MDADDVGVVSAQLGRHFEELRSAAPVRYAHLGPGPGGAVPGPEVSNSLAGAIVAVAHELLERAGACAKAREGARDAEEGDDVAADVAADVVAAGGSGGGGGGGGAGAVAAAGEAAQAGAQVAQIRITPGDIAEAVAESEELNELFGRRARAARPTLHRARGDAGLTVVTELMARQGMIY